MSQKCVGHKKDGSPCGRWALKGSTICTSHGANSRVRIAAKRRLATTEALALVETLDLQPMEDIPGQILTLASEARALLDILHSRVTELQSLSNVDKLGQESISAVLGAYQAQMKQTGALLISIAKLGLSERRLAVAEADTLKLATAVQTGVYAAGPKCDPPLSHEDMRMILSTIGKHLDKAYEN